MEIETELEKTGLDPGFIICGCAMCRLRPVIFSETIPQSSAFDYEFDEVGVFNRRGHPRMHFVEHSYCGDPTNWRLPNRAAVEAMLSSSGFEILSRPEEEVYLCRWQPVAAPADGPRWIYPAKAL